MSDRALIDLDSALATVLGAAAKAVMAQEQVPLGRVLGEDLVASRPVPAFDGSAMDGFAVRSADLVEAGPESPVRLEVIDESRAGVPARRELAAGLAIAISTGAMIPVGADAVIPVEDTALAAGGLDCLATAPVGAWIRRAGEDIASGSTVLGRGTRLGPAELGVAASIGCVEVSCARRPSVAVLVTGDELLGPGEQMRAGGVRDSSSLTIPALTVLAGGEVVGVATLPDQLQATRAGIAAALEQADVTIICGGVSVGAHDHVRPALEELGAHRLFWGVALKPGRPTWFGTCEGKLVFGLPGNPVSAMVTFTLFAAAAIAAMLGVRTSDRRVRATFDTDYAKRPGRTHAVRCRLRVAEDGLHVQPTGEQGSHILTSMLGAEALAIIPAESTGLRAGERVTIEPLMPSLAGAA
jgi:molybdopterin molybdotransferase